jgi:hypothetical protein
MMPSIGVLSMPIEAQALRKKPNAMYTWLFIHA